MSSTPILHIRDIEVSYQRVIVAVRGASLAVPSGAIVALLGANGAGKSSILKAVSRLVSAERGEVLSGRIEYDGEDISAVEPAALVRRGLVQVLEGRHCFAHLSIDDNLRLGAFARRPSRAELAAALERIYGYFPRLKLLRRRQAGYTSGGEQQMLAIGRALMSSPRLVLLDEPSMGLAPKIVDEIFDIVHALNTQEGISFLLAEQNAHAALRYAHHGYVLENGRVVHEGAARDLLDDEAVHAFYLGGTASEAHAA